MMTVDRRGLVKSGLALIATATIASVYRPIGAAARILSGGKKWAAQETLPPVPVDPTKRVFLSDTEYRQIAAIFDRLIPSDELTASASEVGAVTFLDHQLGGPYGRGDALYKSGPFQAGTAQQGVQTSPLAPAETYRVGLKELDEHCASLHGRPYIDLSDADKDDYLTKMEAGTYVYPSLNSKQLFQQMLANVMEGFFADPVYGGNRDMVGWKMIGFPGARYDYRDVAEHKGKPLDIAPISLLGRI